MYTLKKNNTSPLCMLYTLMPQIMPLSTLMLVCTWYSSLVHALGIHEKLWSQFGFARHLALCGKKEKEKEKEKSL
jgi:hypothetical protein